VQKRSIENVEIEIKLRKQVFHLKRELLREQNLPIKVSKAAKRTQTLLLVSSPRNYLSLTNLSFAGLRGNLFMMSLSASSYAREIAGTYMSMNKWLTLKTIFFHTLNKVAKKNPSHPTK